MLGVSGVDKIIEKMKRQPNGIHPEEAEKVLKANGYEYKRQKGSHRLTCTQTET
jgi:predicted RNA binding protein YcfA (HicA-like mRNA interferase family)